MAKNFTVDVFFAPPTLPLPDGERRTRTMHLNSETALNLADGTMNEIEKAYWEKHLESCGDCAAGYRVWADLIESVTRAHLISAPDALVASAKQIFRTNKEGVRTSLRETVASVIFDSFIQTAAATIRAQAATDEQQVATRQVVFQAEDYDIYVRVSMFEDHRDLLGQILPLDNQGFINDANLYLRHDDERIASTAVNQLGEFQFCDVPKGMLSLQIDLPNMTIISALQVTM
jgi:hypothetical protein